jgi:hypothetical protein
MSHRPRHAPAFGLRAEVDTLLDKPQAVQPKGTSIMWPTIASLCLALSKLAPRKARSRRRHAFRCPVLEALEDRTVPSGASLASYGELPLSFEVNRGQTAAPVNYLARGSGYTLFLSATQATLGLTQQPAHKGASSVEDVLRLGLVGANPAAAVVGLDRLPGVSNYFLGNEPSKWLTNVPNYGEVAYQNVYPGVNLVYYGNQGQLEYDFVLAPGADAGAIRLSVQGAQSVRLDAQGDLVLHTAGGDVVQHAPVVYQNIGGQRQAVAGRFVLEGNGQVGFRVGAYDRSAPLVIDPVLVYSTYLGGSGNDSAAGIAVDSAGNAYITGSTNSTNFPTVGALQTTPSGRFVSKLNASGTALVYSTYLGGTGNDSGNVTGIAVDSAGDAYVTGSTTATNFPTTPGAYQTSLGQATGSAFVTKLNATGSALAYSTYLHGGSPYPQSSDSWATSIAVDGAGDAYVTGSTFDTSFPTTPNAFQSGNPASGFYGNAGFVTKLNASGSALVYSTYLGGNNYNIDGFATNIGQAIAVDGAGDAYVTGTTYALDFPTTSGAFQPTNTSGWYNGLAFVTELNPSGTALVYSTYLGGYAGNGDAGNAIAVDASGSAYVTGYNFDQDFPTTPGAFQTFQSGPSAFVTKLNPSGSALAYSTCLGGGPNAGTGYAIAVDSSGNAYVAGETGSTSFPTRNALQGYGGNGDAFVSELNASGSALLFSTYLGGSGGDSASSIALDSAGNIYVTGGTTSTNFPTTPGAYQTAYSGSGSTSDAFVARINPTASSPSLAVAGYPSPTTAGVSHTFTVTALNADGTVNTGYTGTVHFSSSDPKAVLPANYTFTAADHGVHTFTVTLKTTGSQSITAADTANGTVSGSETGIVVQPAAAAKFVLSAPSSVTHGVAFSLTLTVEDAYGNVVTGYTGTVHFSSSDGTATLPANYTFTAADQGVHTFTGVVLRKKGKQTITVTDTLNGALTITDTITVG